MFAFLFGLHDTYNCCLSQRTCGVLGGSGGGGVDAGGGPCNRVGGVQEGGGDGCGVGSGGGPGDPERDGGEEKRVEDQGETNKEGDRRLSFDSDLGNY